MDEKRHCTVTHAARTWLSRFKRAGLGPSSRGSQAALSPRTRLPWLIRMSSPNRHEGDLSCKRGDISNEVRHGRRFCLLWLLDLLYFRRTCGPGKNAFCLLGCSTRFAITEKRAS